MIGKRTLMQNNSVIAGIDIGSAKCCCSIGKIDQDSEKINLLGIGESPSTGMKGN
jgi:cell division ATPase FtsA